MTLCRRILFINKASLRHEGGAESRTREIGKRLVASGHEVVVLAAKTNICEPPVEIIDGMTLCHKKVLPDFLIRRFPAPRYLPLAAANLFLMVHLYLLLKRERFDCIREDLSPFPPSFLLALVSLPVSLRIAVVHNMPGTMKGWIRSYGLLYGWVGYLFDRFLRAGRLKYDRIICVAKWLDRDLKRSSKIAMKVHYVPNGVDVAQFSEIRVTRPKTGAIRLLSVGRLVEMKGFRFLIEALSILKQNNLRPQLTIFGDGPLKGSLIQLARQLKVEDQVEIRSPVPHNEMPLIYTECDFLVFPSLSEGLSLSLLEAMAARLPIVATDIPGTADVLNIHAATMCQSENAQDLADKLRRAFDHPDDIRHKTEAAYQIANNYSWDRCKKQEWDEPLITETFPE